MTAPSFAMALLDDLAFEPQVRTTIAEAGLEEHAASIRSVGVLQPIRARRVNGQLIVTDGHRRCLAARKAGLQQVPVVIDETPVTPSEVLLQQLIANCQREDLTPLEKAKGIAELQQLTKATAAQVAAQLGFSEATVCRLLALLALPPEIQAEVAAGRISTSAAYELSQLENLGEQHRYAAKLAAGKLTRDDLARIRKARQGRSEPHEEPPPVPREKPRLFRAVAPLGELGSVTVSCNPTLDAFITLLELVTTKARKGRSQGLQLNTFLKQLRDQASHAS